jgi:hypothetical protein
VWARHRLPAVGSPIHKRVHQHVAAMAGEEQPASGSFCQQGSLAGFISRVYQQGPSAGLISRVHPTVPWDH